MTFKQARDAGYYAYRYPNGDWEYRGEKGNIHFYRNGVELTKGVIAKDFWPHLNGDWAYIDEDDIKHEMPKEQA